MTEEKYIRGTAMAPAEKKRPTGSKDPRVAVPNWSGPKQAGGVTASNGDPFVNGAGKSVDAGKLCGKAASFSPAKSGDKSPMNYLNIDSQPDVKQPAIVNGDRKPSPYVSCEKAKPKNVQQPVGTPGPKASPTRSRAIFTTDVGIGIQIPGGHYLKVDNVLPADLQSGWKLMCEDMGWEAKTRGYVIPPPVNGSKTLVVYLCFDDLRDAAQALQDVEMVNPTWNAKYITQIEYACSTSGDLGKKKPSSFYDGQVTYTAIFNGRNDSFFVDGLCEYVERAAGEFGEVIAIEETILDSNVRQFRVEHTKISDAQFAAFSVTDSEPIEYKGWNITARELPDPNAAVTPKHGRPINGTPQKLVDGAKLQFASPTGRTAWVLDDHGNPVPTQGAKQPPKCRSIPFGTLLTPNGRDFRTSDPLPYTPATCMPGIAPQQRSNSWPESGGPKTAPQPKRRHHDVPTNRIDLQRIKEGIDVRTTIMVRNIPNEMTTDQLVEVLNTVCYGRYDFVYLRFDFQKNQNVGYAFVNLNTPEDVRKFFLAFDGKEYIKGMGHTRHHGPRYAEFAYATVQGQDCAIEKFRNSSVMCEYPGYRPKLYWTEEDAPEPALIGVERDFPGVNNLSKHNRSKDNAAQIGLYAPKNRYGVAIPRTSQYDRGTPAQMEEDAYLQEQIMPVQFPCGFNPNYTFATQQMPVGGYQMMYGIPNAYFPGHMMMPPSPSPYASNGFQSPTVQGIIPSRLRTITQGRLGGVRPRTIVHPGRDYDTAIRQIEENRREQAQYDAYLAQLEAQEAEEAQAATGGPVQHGQYADVPRHFGPENGGGDSGYQECAGDNGMPPHNTYAAYSDEPSPTSYTFGHHQ